MNVMSELTEQLREQVNDGSELLTANISKDGVLAATRSAWLVWQARAALSPQPVTEEPTYSKLEQMYFDQCRTTDDFAAKYDAEVERKGDARIAELEAQLAGVNAKLIERNAYDENQGVAPVAPIEAISKAFITSYNYGTEVKISLKFEHRNDAYQVHDFLLGVKRTRADLSPQPSIADQIHYPACWDTVNYPTLESALIEIVAEFKCSECNPQPTPKVLTDENILSALQQAGDFDVARGWNFLKVALEDNVTTLKLIEVIRALLEGAK